MYQYMFCYYYVSVLYLFGYSVNGHFSIRDIVTAHGTAEVSNTHAQCHVQVAQNYKYHCAAILYGHHARGRVLLYGAIK